VLERLTVDTGRFLYLQYMLAAESAALLLGRDL